MKLRCAIRKGFGLLRPASSSLAGAGLVIAMAVAEPALAQDSKMTPIAISSEPGAIQLGTGPLPGAKAPESWHSQYGSRCARNVAIATLTPFLPDPRKATGERRL